MVKGLTGCGLHGYSLVSILFGWSINNQYTLVFKIYNIFALCIERERERERGGGGGGGRLFLFLYCQNLL